MYTCSHAQNAPHLPTELGFLGLPKDVAGELDGSRALRRAVGANLPS